MIELSATEIARALNGKKHGFYWTARCPAHDDKHPSLSISEGANGAVLVTCHAGCSQDEVLEALRGRGLWPEGRRDNIRPDKACTTRDHRTHDARQIWTESLDPGGTWAEDYLTSRGLVLPADPEILRTLRFHPSCPWGGARVPALIAAFKPIEPDVPDDPFLDPPPVAIHRIRGRGHENKKMLGPVKGCAVMISPWWYVWDTLHVCEGVETALALYNEGAADPDDAYRPIWALGSAGALRALPIVSRVHRLRIFADNDASGAGTDAAREAAHRWQQAGKQVVVRHLRQEGIDYADREG